MTRLTLVIVAVMLAASETVFAQEHAPPAPAVARPEPVTVVSRPAPVTGVSPVKAVAAPATGTRDAKPVVSLKPQEALKVTAAQPPATVAAAIAEALRAAEAAATRRARPPVSPSATPSAQRAISSVPQRHYEVAWPEQRLVVRWPSGATATDRVTLAWPDALTDADDDPPFQP